MKNHWWEKLLLPVGGFEKAPWKEYAFLWKLESN